MENGMGEAMKTDFFTPSIVFIIAVDLLYGCIRHSELESGGPDSSANTALSMPNWNECMNLVGTRGNDKLAREICSACCNKKEASCCTSAGELWSSIGSGLDFEVDLVRSKDFFEKACVMNSETGCLSLGHLWHIGVGDEKDEEKARYYYGESCELGLGLACYYLGLSLYQYSNDHVQSVELLNRACEKGCIPCCGNTKLEEPWELVEPYCFAAKKLDPARAEYFTCNNPYKGPLPSKTRK